MSPVNTHFVTGATGVVGSALVPVLLRDPEAQVALLIRADSLAHLSARLETLYHFWGVSPEDTDFRTRVRALRGDATMDRFGLGDTDYDDLCGQCTHIIHAAGAVRMTLPIEEARRSAVGAAHQIVALAKRCVRLEKVEFVSTVGVGGRLARVPEDWISEPREFHNTYEQAKAEAEAYVREEVRRGLPLTVHRPSMVVGDSRTGKILHFQVFYHLCEFLSGRRTFGLFPQLGTARLDTIPVDVVAGVLAWSSRQPRLAGRVLHLCTGPEHAVRLTDLRSRVRIQFSAHGLKVPPKVPLPPGVFTALLSGASRFMDAKTRRAAATLPVFLDYLASEQRFENESTGALLKSAGIELPHWETYLGTVLGAYLRHQMVRT